MSGMKEMRYILMLTLLLVPFGARAQDDGAFYQDAVGASSMLWRGHKAYAYPSLVDGTPWWDDMTFMPGAVVYNGRTYTNVLLNIDAVRQDLVARDAASGVEKVVWREGVTRFHMGGKAFLHLRALYGEGMPSGYWQVLYDGHAKLVKQVSKKLGKDESGLSGVRAEVRYGHIAADGTWTPLTRRNQLQKLYPSFRGDIRRHVAELERDGMFDFETYCLAVIRYVDERQGPFGETLDPVFASLPSKGYQVTVYGAPVAKKRPLMDRLPAGYFESRSQPVLDTSFREYLATEASASLGDVRDEASVVTLRSAVVTAESRMQHRTSQLGVEIVRANTIKNVPVVFGESDALKVIMTLPGVKSVGEAAGGFNVRGGSTDQNLILFNGGTVYNPNHMFGILSAFNTDVIKGMELYKSSIPAEYGGRISSVLDINGRDGDPRKFKGSLGLGLLTSRLQLEGPIVKDKTTFILGARTTYSNWLLRLLPSNSAYAGGKASFQDANLGLRHQFNERNTLHAYGYFSRDKFSFSGDTTFRYRNLNGSLRWDSRLNERFTMTASAGYDSYHYSLEDTFNEYEAYRLSNAVDQGFAKVKFAQELGGAHTLDYGVHSLFYNVNPGDLRGVGDKSLVESLALPRERAMEAAVYVSDMWKPNDAFSADFGVRWSQFIPVGGGKTYGGPEFRLSGKYTFGTETSVKAGFNTMRQYIHLISNSVNISPVDSWRLCSDRIRPQTGWQAAGGVYQTLMDGQVDLSLEGYYKHIQHYLDYKGGAMLVMNPNLADDLVETENRSYGVEVMARKSAGKLNGWVSYTWSRSRLRETGDRGDEAINSGTWYNAPYDRPHDVKVVANYRFTKRYSISVNLDYATGRPVTLPVGQYEYGNGVWLVYSDRNAYRIPDYFRLDLAMMIEPSHYLKQLTHLSVTFGCYNVTGRKNPYSVYFSSDGTSITGHMLSVFAVPIPYINFNLRF